MRALARVWHFVAGDSRRAPVVVAIALATGFALTRAHAPVTATATLYATTLVLALVAAVFEPD